VIINVLLRRALCEKNPLSKWVLLGALEVLQGRTPNLTPTMLSQLVNVSQHTEKSNIQPVKPIIPTTLSQLVNVSQHPKESNIPSTKAMKKNPYSEKEISNSIISESVGTQVDSVLKNEQFSDKSTQIRILTKTRDIDVQCMQVAKENKEIQCMPATLTKWIQVKQPKLMSNWSQTLIKVLKHNETQTLSQNYVKNEAQVLPQNNFINEAQTSPHNNVKKSIESPKKDIQESLKPIKNRGHLIRSWKLVEVDDIPKKRRKVNLHQISSESSNSNPSDKMNGRNYSQTDSNASSEDGSEDSPMFYGRPLIERKSKLEVEIPFHPKAKIQDPRLQKHNQK
ncbi:unnamed protein product, partial [Meganyctiphanes norvegica]